FMPASCPHPGAHAYSFLRYAGGMALVARRRLLADGELSVERVTCDGHDGAAPRDEAWPLDQLVVVLRGDFALRHRRGRGFADVQTAVLARGGQPLRLSHPRGRGDIC